ncbi:MAG TPA: choice-of-anchor Q domain-containing protein [Candidatus Angelobacter sp.]
MRKLNVRTAAGPEVQTERKRSAMGVAILLLMIAVLAGAGRVNAQTQPPQIFFTDMDSGPNSGGESISGFAGAYVTLYGNFLGASQGSSTITWNGQNCLRVVGPTGSYNGWGSSYFWYQRIIVQLGSGCTAGSGNFVVTINGKASNGYPFTVRSTGKIFFVATAGKDTNAGTAASPFLTVPRCKSMLNAGDTCYIENGVVANTVDNFDATLELEKGGSAGSPIAFVAYPGATATLGSASITYGIRVPNISVSANYVTVAGLFFSPSQQGMNPTNSTNWRVVGNNFQCPTANGQDGCFTTNEISTIKYLGNEVTNVGVVAASKQQHAVYFSSDTNHVEAAWNYIHNNRSCRAMQFHSSPLGGGGANDPTGHNMFDLSVHDNLIHDDPCDGINFATVDPSQGKVEAYNNVIYHVGIGPSPQDGDSGDYSCIYMAYITNTGPVGGGTVEIYNNTLSDCGPHVASFANNGAFMINGGAPSLMAKIRNNVAYQLGSEPFGSGGGWNASLVSGSNNIFHSTGSVTAPTFTTGNLTSDPLFMNLSINNYQLQSGSPAIDAGITINSGNTYLNFMPWNGNPSDNNGVSRPQGTSYDIGAFEFFTGSGSRPNPPTNISAVPH